jgi:uncharacterized DUF497 family protein
MTVAGFEWDNGNRRKCQKHGVSIAAIEEIFRQPLAVFPAHSQHEERFKAIGKTYKGRHILIVFTLRLRRGIRLIRPISARYMHRKEVEHYEKEIARS